MIIPTILAPSRTATPSPSLERLLSCAPTDQLVASFSAVSKQAAPLAVPPGFALVMDYLYRSVMPEAVSRARCMTDFPSLQRVNLRVEALDIGFDRKAIISKFLRTHAVLAPQED
jgi:hypothetical protein